MTVGTIKDIAKLCNVSTSTVSRAINGESGINKETKARILEVIKEHNFVPNSSARDLKKIKSNTIALLVPAMKNLLFQEMFDRFGKELNRTEYSFSIHAYNHNEIDVAIDLIKERKLKGIIFMGGDFNGYEEKKHYLTIPSVRCAGAELPDTSTYPGPSIAIDDEKESYRVTDYLCKKGHKKIAIIASFDSETSVAALRIKGYKRALKENGIEFDPAYVISTDPDIEDFTMENGYATTRKLLRSGLDFTALFATSDALAIGAYKAMYDEGKKISEDYSIVGFDGIDLGNYLSPGLTTLTQPARFMVKSAINNMEKLWNGEAVEKRIVFEGMLTERGSVRDLSE